MKWQDFDVLENNESIRPTRELTLSAKKKRNNKEAGVFEYLAQKTKLENELKKEELKLRDETLQLKKAKLEFEKEKWKLESEERRAEMEKNSSLLTLLQNIILKKQN